MKYVLGFVFSWDGSRVLLIQKDGSIPAHKGLLNGLGGKVEKEEQPKDAIVREVYEESGLSISDSRWEQTTILQILSPCPGVPGAEVFVFRAFVSDMILDSARTMTHEPIHIYSTDVATLSKKVVPNLHWLIPMQLDKSIVPPVYVPMI